MPLQLTSSLANNRTAKVAFKSRRQFGTFWPFSFQVCGISSTFNFCLTLPAAGLFSSVVSHVAATRILYPRLISQLSSTSAAVTATAAAAKPASSSLFKLAQPLKDILPSLGASGAIYAAVSLTALGFPDSEVSLIFLPGVLIPSQVAVGALVCVDMVGIFRGWRMFDHYAHVAGALFGAVYWKWGPQWWDWMRIRLGRPAHLTPNPDS